MGCWSKNTVVERSRRRISPTSSHRPDQCSPRREPGRSEEMKRLGKPTIRTRIQRRSHTRISSHTIPQTTRRLPLPHEEGVREVIPLRCGQWYVRPHINVRIPRYGHQQNVSSRYLSIIPNPRINGDQRIKLYRQGELS